MKRSYRGILHGQQKKKKKKTQRVRTAKNDFPILDFWLTMTLCIVKFRLDLYNFCAPIIKCTSRNHLLLSEIWCWPSLSQLRLEGGKGSIHAINSADGVQCGNTTHPRPGGGLCRQSHTCLKRLDIRAVIAAHVQVHKILLFFVFR